MREDKKESRWEWAGWKLWWKVVLDWDSVAWMRGDEHGGRSSMNCAENRGRWVRERVDGIRVCWEQGGWGREARLFPKAHVASSVFPFLHPPSIHLWPSTNEPYSRSMFKLHDKISPARLTLFKAMFVIKPIYHEESMLHGLLSIFCFFFFFALFPSTSYDSRLPLLWNAQCPVIFPHTEFVPALSAFLGCREPHGSFCQFFFCSCYHGPFCLPISLSQQLNVLSNLSWNQTPSALPLLPHLQWPLLSFII